MHIVQEQVDGATVLAPKARIDSSTASIFEDALLAAVQEGNGNVVVDFIDVDYISSAGLRAVLEAAKRARARGGKLVLCGMKSTIRQVFDISGFSKILPIKESRADIAGMF